jgi:tRNA dimethylallyltransferase
MQNIKQKIIVIAGPTATGKSDLAVQAAQKFSGEIISADSMQIYKKLDIGTAKVDIKTRKRVPHHLIDIVDFDNEFSAAQFAAMAKEAIENIASRKKIPVVAGGTGLYIDSLLYPHGFSGATKNPKIRAELEKTAEEKGVDALYQTLLEIDEQSAEKIHRNDKKRIIRALEIYYSTGKTKSESRDDMRESVYDAIFVGLNCERKTLYNMIDERVDKMFESGLLSEIKFLERYPQRFSWQSMQAIGYKEFESYYLSGGTLTDNFSDNALTDKKISEQNSLNIENCPQDELEKIKSAIKQNSRNYAKRQLTWFRRYKDIVWFDCIAQRGQALDYIAEKLKESN